MTTPARRLLGMFWWIDRWRKSTAYTDMTLEEQGAYRNLLDEAHLRGGPLPNDERILAKACGDALRWADVREHVMARFTLTDSGWRNSTLDEVLTKTVQLSEERSLAGKNGNEKRWSEHRKSVASAVAKGVANASSPSPSPSPSPYQSPSPSPIPVSKISLGARAPSATTSIAPVNGTGEPAHRAIARQLAKEHLQKENARKRARPFR